VQRPSLHGGACTPAASDTCQKAEVVTENLTKSAVSKGVAPAVAILALNSPPAPRPAGFFFGPAGACVPSRQRVIWR
jgi:hypothetical protein